MKQTPLVPRDKFRILELVPQPGTGIGAGPTVEREVFEALAEIKEIPATQTQETLQLSLKRVIRIRYWSRKSQPKLKAEMIVEALDTRWALKGPDVAVDALGLVRELFAIAV